MFPRLQCDFTLEPWLSPRVVRTPTLVIPDQRGRLSCWAATTSAVRGDYKLPLPPPNCEHDFAVAYWKKAGVVLGGNRAWDDGVDDLEPVLEFGRLLFGGALKASPSLETAIQTWLDQRTYLIVGEPTSSGPHAVVVSDWNGDASAPLYFWHDPEAEGTYLDDYGFDEAFPEDTVFFRTTRTWGAP